jgi:hypothetical protein
MKMDKDVVIKQYMKAVGISAKAIKVLEENGFLEEAAELREELRELGFRVLSDKEKEEKERMKWELEEMGRRFLERLGGEL